jgi:hypothetical protein
VASFDEAIPPGQAGTIKASIHTANLSGAIGKTIQVMTNDPTQANIALNIMGNVAASVQLLPSSRMVVYGRGQQRPFTAKLLVRRDPSETAELVVSDVKPSVPWMTATARKVSAPETIQGAPQTQPNDWVVEVQVTPPPNTPENSAQQLTFKTGLKLEPVIVVPVTIMVPQFVSVQPGEVLLRPVDGAPSEGTVLVVVRQDLDPASAKFEAQPGVFKVETAQAGPTPRHLRVTVKANPSDVRSDSAGMLTVRLGEEARSIPIRIAAPTK